MKYLALVVLLALSPFTLANDCGSKMKSAKSSSTADKVASVEIGKIASKLRPAKCLLKLKRLQLTKSRSNIIQSHCLVAFFLAVP